MAAIKLKVGGRVRLYRKDSHLKSVGVTGLVAEIKDYVLKDYGWVLVDFDNVPHWVSIYCLAHA